MFIIQNQFIIPKHIVFKYENIHIKQYCFKWKKLNIFKN